MKYQKDLLKIRPPDFIDPFEPKPCPCCGKRPEIKTYNWLGEPSCPVFEFRCPTTKRLIHKVTLGEPNEPIAILDWNTRISWEEITKVIEIGHKMFETAQCLGPAELGDFKEELRESMFPFWVAKAARTAIYVKENP